MEAARSSSDGNQISMEPPLSRRETRRARIGGSAGWAVARGNARGNVRPQGRVMANSHPQPEGQKRNHLHDSWRQEKVR